MVDDEILFCEGDHGNSRLMSSRARDARRRWVGPHADGPIIESTRRGWGEHLVAAYDSAVGSSLTVRLARVEDVAQMARVNVRCWQETYRGLTSDAVLDDPGFLAARERFWTAALTDERYRENRAAVAERDGELIGIAMSGPPLDASAAWTRQLYVLYVYAADHGTGAGRALLEAVIDAAESAAAVGRRSQSSRARVLPQARLRCRRDGPGRGRRAGDSHGPRRATRSVAHSPVAAPRWRHGLDGARRRVSRLAT
jgi:GNAT superfamily N-acetyltransferase